MDGTLGELPVRKTESEMDPVVVLCSAELSIFCEENELGLSASVGVARFVTVGFADVVAESEDDDCMLGLAG